MSVAFAEFGMDTQSEFFLPRKTVASAALLPCLVVSAAAERGEFFEAAADRAGWQVTALVDAISAGNAAHRFRHSLVIVDLDGEDSSHVGELRALVEQLSSDPGRLLIVCGTEGNPLEEIWARQLGAWLYLAGVDLSCDVESLCSEARQLTEKLTRPVKQTYARTA